MNTIRKALVTVDQWGRFSVSDFDDINVILPGLEEAWETNLVTEDSNGFDCGMEFSLTRAGREYLHGPQPSWMKTVTAKLMSAIAQMVRYPSA